MRQLVMGNYTDDVTVLGTLGQMLLGFGGLDTAADIRDLTYDPARTTTKGARDYEPDIAVGRSLGAKAEIMIFLRRMEKF